MGLLFLAALLLAIPGNFLLIMSDAYQYVPRTLAFNLAELMLLVTLTAWLANQRVRLNFATGDYLFITYLLWCRSVVAYHWIFGRELIDEIGRSIANFSRAVLMLQVFWYLIGRVLLRKHQPSARILWIFYALLLLSVISHTNAETFRVDFAEVGEAGLNYLAIADPFAIWAFLLLGRTAKHRWRFLFAWASALLALFVIGSRGTLYAFIGAGVVYGVIVAPRLWLAILASLAITGTTVVGSAVDDAADLGRMFALISIAEDRSFLERVDQRDVGLRRISESPITGDYGGTIRDFGSLGAYIHDITSYWQQFGLGPFLSVLALLALSGRTFVQAAKRIKQTRPLDYIDQFLVLYFPFVTIQLAFARSYDWPYCWLLVGLAISRLNAGARRRTIQRRAGILRVAATGSEVSPQSTPPRALCTRRRVQRRTGPAWARF